MSNGDFCDPLITIANSLHKQKVNLDLDPNHLTIKQNFLKKNKFEKSQQTTAEA